MGWMSGVHTTTAGLGLALHWDWEQMGFFGVHGWALRIPNYTRQAKTVALHWVRSFEMDYGLPLVMTMRAKREYEL